MQTWDELRVVHSKSRLDKVFRRFVFRRFEFTTTACESAVITLYPSQP